MSKVFDASAIIRAWEYYPQGQFPGFWRWVAGELKSRRWMMSRANLDEVRHKVPELHEWLLTHDLYQIEVSNEIAAKVIQIKGILGIMDDNYAPDGVDEADLILIATCACLGHVCVNCESDQLGSMRALRNSKIPRVCRQEGIDVTSVDLLPCITQPAIVFDDFERL